MLNRKIKTSFGLLAMTVALLLCVTCYAQEEAQIPQHRGYVNDFANVIQPSDKAAIQAFALELDRKTTAQIAVLTIPTTKPLAIQQYSVAVFDKWGIGTKAKDNGVLIVLAVNDREVWITPGYGLEGAIPDVIASQISNQVMIPQFKKGDLSKGLLLGVVAVAQLVAKEYNVELTGTAEYAESINLTPVRPAFAFLRFLMTLAFFILFFGLRSGMLFYFLLGGAGRRRGGMWYGTGYGGTGGGFSGGFGGFGGGLTGGGGAGGGW